MSFSLNKKVIVLIVSFAAIISMLAVAVYYKGIHDVVVSQYEGRSIDIAKLTAVEIDAERLLKVQQAVLEIYNSTDNKVLSDQAGTPEFEAYLSRYKSIEEMEEYQTVRADLRRMQDVLDVDCLYVIWLDTVNGCYVYLVDADNADPCPPGCIDPLYSDIGDTLTDPSLGCPPNITNTPEYGGLVTTAMPVYDSRGEVIAMAAVDISMDVVMARQQRYLVYVVLAFLGMTILVCVLSILLVNHYIVRPINTLSSAAAQYRHNKKVFSSLHISGRDEIGTLAASMVQMEADIDGYITNLKRTSNDLISAREHAEQMDRAANIDALTKVRNKRAYDIEVQRLNESPQPYGLIMIDLNGLKGINDTYGHEKGDISIKTLCQMICRVFQHSPVYRVGGDEFIVILENSDYQERSALIQTISDQFQRNLADTVRPPWERVTAAVGYAVCEPGTGERVESVLKRADAAMYQNKKAMKAALKS